MKMFRVFGDLWINLDQVVEVSRVPNTQTRTSIRMTNDRTYTVNEKALDLVQRMSADAAADALR